MIRHRHLNINSQDGGLLTASRVAAPGEGEPLPPSSGAAAARSPVVLPDPYGLYLSIIAAHDRCSREDFVQRAICRRLDEIGISRALDLAMDAGGIEHEHCVGGAEVARRSHKPEVAGSNPAPATSITPAEEGREEVPSGLLPVPRAPP